MFKVNDTAIWDSLQFGKGTELIVQGFSPNKKVARVLITKAGNTGKPVKATTYTTVKSLKPFPKPRREPVGKENGFFQPLKEAPKKTAAARKRSAQAVAKRTAETLKGVMPTPTNGK